MAIHKYMRAALKALSYVDVDIRNHYELIRRMERTAKKPRIKTYRTWDCRIGEEGQSVPVRIFSPSTEKRESPDSLQAPLIVFFHGGGWVTGDLDSYERVCLTIARQTSHALIAADYRLAPENPFPAALEDCYQTVKTLLQWREESGFSQPIILMGDSAGGNLAAALSLYLRDRGEKNVDKQILIYPATYNDHTETSPFPSVSENGTDYLLTSKRVCEYMDLYCRNQTDRSSPYFAPLLADDFSHQPDTLIITAQYDPLRDEAEEYGRRLREAGNRVVVRRIADALHGYFSLSARFTVVRDSYRIINQFLWGDMDG